MPSAARTQAACHKSVADEMRDWWTPETRKDRLARIKALADAEWNAIESEVDPVRHARRTYENMTPERRAEIWEA